MAVGEPERATGSGAGDAGAAAAVRVARGARAAEALLLDALEAHVAEARADPRLLARPVRVVVPSQSLRLHVAAALVRRVGGATAGLRVQTLHGLARECLERSGVRLRTAELLFPVRVRREARGQPALRRELHALRDGYGAVAAVAADLLDAGFEPAHAEALEEALEALEALEAHGEAAAAPAARERARAALRVAAAVQASLAAEGRAHRSELLRRAAEAIKADPEGALPARALHVHGFADATGVATDLLEELVRRRGARVVVDLPPDPAAPARADPGVAFAEPLLARLGAAAGAAPAEAPAPPRATTPELLEAPGAEAEARAVVRRVRALLDEGVRPESVGLVARDLSEHAAPLRRHLRRLGVPFSGAPEAPGPPGPEKRPLEALLDLLRRGGEAPVERWLEAWRPHREPRRAAARRAELRLALHHAGAARLAGAAALDADALLGAREALPLPVRRGLRADEAEPGEEEGTEGASAEASARPRVYAARRKLPGALLREALEGARATLEVLEAWPEEERAEAQLRRLRRFLERTLGRREDAPGAAALARALGRLEAELPPEVPLARADLALLAERALAEAVARPLGGAGAGVALLGAMEARGRTFEHLFVMGANRDRFPRRVVEDPLLPDALRRRLARDVLPELAVKSRGYDEERYLFAQLLSASPRVHVSWQSASDEGRARTRSPLVERVRVARGLAPRRLPPPLADPAEEAPGPRPAQEHALRAGLHGSAERHREALALALDERGRDVLPLPGADGERLAAVRRAVLDEIDALPPRGAALGPYLGLLGPVRERADPRRAPLHVTTLERLATCPWQTFLARMLRLEPLPDPLGALPGADPLLVGTVVHGALERIAQGEGPALPQRVEEALAREPRALRWPDAAGEARQLEAAARAALDQEGIRLPGFARALADLARPYLARARELLEREAPLALRAAEAHGVLEVADASGRTRLLHFKADLVEGRGAPRLTDYKTGRSFADRAKPETRHAHLLRGVARGERLQAVAYALATGVEEGSGRYLFLDPGLAHPEAAELGVRGDDAAAAGAFRRAAATLLEALEEGSLPPRLVDAAGESEPPACERCAVAEACLRGDSGVRRRLASWAAARREAGAPEDALDGIWRLPEAEA